jgi:hypothetical protein
VQNPKGLAVCVLAAVGVVEAARQPRADEHAQIERNGQPPPTRPRDELVEAHPRDMLLRHEVRVVLAPEVKHLHHVGVRQAHRHARLAEVRVDEGLLMGQRGQHALHHHGLLEALHAVTLGAVHLRHAAEGDTIEQLIATEEQGRCVGHVGVS